jgi:hypothetical protein
LGNAARFGTDALDQARRSWSDLLAQTRMHSFDII